MKHLLGQQVVNRQRFQQAYNKTKAELLEERRDNADLRKELSVVRPQLQEQLSKANCQKQELTQQLMDEQLLLVEANLTIAKANKVLLTTAPSPSPPLPPLFPTMPVQ